MRGRSGCGVMATGTMIVAHLGQGIGASAVCGACNVSFPSRPPSFYSPDHEQGVSSSCENRVRTNAAAEFPRGANGGARKEKSRARWGYQGAALGGYHGMGGSSAGTHRTGFPGFDQGVRLHVYVSEYGKSGRSAQVSGGRRPLTGPVPRGLLPALRHRPSDVGFGTLSPAFAADGAAGLVLDDLHQRAALAGEIGGEASRGRNRHQEVGAALADRTAVRNGVRMVRRAPVERDFEGEGPQPGHQLTLSVGELQGIERLALANPAVFPCAGFAQPPVRCLSLFLVDF